MEERVQKIMAKAGLGSRRANEKLIRAGRVRVNGRVARLGEKADPDVDDIEVDGEPIVLEKLVYVMLNKPRGVLSSTEDELDQGRPTVRDMVDLEGHIYPVGRLDKNSEGLILLTNDGKLAHRLTHPRFEHEKDYLVTLEGHPPPEALAQWRRGLDLRGKRTIPAKINVLEESQDTTQLRITLREGRKRQIRRVAAQLGYPVLRLFRERIATLHLGDLPSGQWRFLDADEIRALRAATGLSTGTKRR